MIRTRNKKWAASFGRLKLSNAREQARQWKCFRLKCPPALAVCRSTTSDSRALYKKRLMFGAYQAVAQPYAHFEMTSGGERVSFTTRTSDFPSGNNANFLERKVLNVLLPEDPLYAPHLCIRVSCIGPLIRREDAFLFFRKQNTLCYQVHT